MEKKEAKQANLQRRNFLLTLGAGSAGAAAVVVGAAASAPQVLQQAVKTDAEPGQGYALSEHVRNYYRTTRI
jgi:hypothetical protein